MSRRRLRNAVMAALTKNGFPKDTVVVIAGLSNTYSDYVVTFEEYQVQREGGREEKGGEEGREGKGMRRVGRRKE